MCWVRGSHSQRPPKINTSTQVREGSARIATAADVFEVADAAAKLAEEHGGFVEKRSDNGGYDTPQGKRGQEARPGAEFLDHSSAGVEESSAVIILLEHGIPRGASGRTLSD